jgi:hypothetical protein
MKYQAKEVSVPAGSAAGLKSTAFNLDMAYKRVTGVALYEKKDGGITSYDIAIKDQFNNYLHDPTDKADWKSFGIERYKKIDLENAGQQMIIDIITRASNASEIALQLVFRLEI